MQRHQQDGVDVAAGQVLLEAVLVVARLGDKEHQLQPVGGEHLADPAHEARKEGVGEQPAGGLGDHDTHRVAAAGDQAAGGPVGHVAELPGCPLDGPPSVVADPRIGGEDPRRGGPGDAGKAGDLLQGYRGSACKRSHEHPCRRTKVGCQPTSEG